MSAAFFALALDDDLDALWPVDLGVAAPFAAAFAEEPVSLILGFLTESDLWGV